MNDLFDPRPEPPPSYPDSAGFKVRGTSKEQAAKIEPKAKILRDKVLKALAHRSMTTDECAAFLGEDILSVRPRFSELARTVPPSIVPTGERRASSRGNMSDVWGIV